MRCDTPERLSMRLSIARLERDALDHFGDEIGNAHRQSRRARVHASCCVIAIPSSTVSGIVRHDLASDAILERRDDLAARRVVLGIRGEAEQHVERQAHRDIL